MTEFSKLTEDGKLVDTVSIPQENLTSDCWFVQAWGINYCIGCECLKKPECGGGGTLVEIIHYEAKKRFGYGLANDRAMWVLYDLIDATNRTSFYQITRKHNREIGSWHILKLYNRIIHDIKTKEEAAATRIRSLDSMFPYEVISKNWLLLEKKGWHVPDDNICGCAYTTPKGAYRHETYISSATQGVIVHYLHQHAIVVEIIGNFEALDKGIYLDSCGWRTMTTKEYINKYQPNRVYNDKGKWLVNIGNVSVPFYDGMVVPI